jgi:RNA polymerase sigma-70 factor (ECF subfamily)
MDDDGDLGNSWKASASIDPVSDQVARDLEFELFYLAEMPKVVAFLMVQGAQAATAADIAQEAMLEAYRQWNAIDIPRAWVRTVAARTWWRTHKAEQAERPSDQLPEPDRLLSEDAASEIEARHIFLALMRRLPPAQREAMAWTYDGYRPTEIAAVLGKPPGTVRSVLRQAREALKTQRPAIEETP